MKYRRGGPRDSKKSTKSAAVAATRAKLFAAVVQLAERSTTLGKSVLTPAYLARFAKISRATVYRYPEVIEELCARRTQLENDPSPADGELKVAKFRSEIEAQIAALRLRIGELEALNAGMARQIAIYEKQRILYSKPHVSTDQRSYVLKLDSRKRR